MYAYIKFPMQQAERPERNQKKEGFSFGALATSALKMDFEGKDGVFAQIAQGVGQLEDLNAKFSIIAMSQLLKDGKVSSEDALNYFFTGFAPQLGNVAVAMGYQSLGAMKEALRNGTINGGQFMSSFGGFIEYMADQSVTRNINKQENIIVDLVISESISKISETAERRVQVGQTLTEFIHNMPETYEFTCMFINGVTYDTKEEFEWLLDDLRDSKIEVTVQIGENEHTNLVLTNYTPTRSSAIGGFEYILSFKKIKRGSVELKKINIQELTARYQKTANIINNLVDDKAKEKTESKNNLGGLKEILFDAKQAYDSFTN